MKKIFLLCLLLTIFLNISYAQNSPVGIVVKVKGILELKEGDNWVNISKGQILNNGDEIQTKTNSIAAIKFTDGKGVIKLKENTILTIMGSREAAGLDKKIFMEIGNIWIKATQQENEFLIETPTAVASIKGSEGYEEQNENGDNTLWVIEGDWEFYNENGSQNIGPNETGSAAPGEAPTSAPTNPDDLPGWGNEGGGSDDPDDVETDIIQIELTDQNGQIQILEIEVGPPSE